MSLHRIGCKCCGFECVRWARVPCCYSTTSTATANWPEIAYAGADAVAIAATAIYNARRSDALPWYFGQLTLGGGVSAANWGVVVPFDSGGTPYRVKMYVRIDTVTMQILSRVERWSGSEWVTHGVLVNKSYNVANCCGGETTLGLTFSSGWPGSIEDDFSIVGSSGDLAIEGNECCSDGGSDCFKAVQEDCGGLCPEEDI